MLVAYAGPETILPLSSAMAVVTGVVLAFWPRLVKFIRALASGGIRLVLARNPREISGNRPADESAIPMAKPRSEPSLTI